jgi:DNA-directed RNA polymerase subunit E"
MVKSKACLRCRTIFEGDKCPQCNETAFSDSSKGEAVIFNAEKSVIGRKMKVNVNGRYAIKIK